MLTYALAPELANRNRQEHERGELEVELQLLRDELAQMQQQHNQQHHHHSRHHHAPHPPVLQLSGRRLLPDADHEVGFGVLEVRQALYDMGEDLQRQVRVGGPAGTDAHCGCSWRTRTRAHALVGRREVVEPLTEYLLKRASTHTLYRLILLSACPPYRRRLIANCASHACPSAVGRKGLHVPSPLAQPTHALPYT